MKRCIPQELAQELWDIEAAGQVGKNAWTVCEYQAEIESAEGRRYFWPSETSRQGFVLWRRTLQEAWILQLAVKDKGKGQGGHMLQDFLARLKGEGLASVGLEVRRSNASACRLYTAAGFRQVGERLKYYRDGDDALVYKLELYAASGESS